MDNLFFLEAKCINKKKPITNEYETFYIRYDKAAGGVWTRTYGVIKAPQNATGDSFKQIRIDISQARKGPQYRCPHCGNSAYVRCGCGKLTCMPASTKEFVCAHCGKKGVITGTIKDIGGSSGVGQA